MLHQELTSILSGLPEHLQERTRRLPSSTTLSTPLGDPDQASTHGDFILYWMHHSLRGHENPALDVAIHLAHRLDQPLLVYQGLSENHPYANDRRHTFILQGAGDVHAELAEQKISSVLHVARAEDRGPHLKTLAARAAVLVTDDVPTAPTIHWRNRLADSIKTPIVCVNGACIVPPQLVKRAFDRAFAYREATAWLYKTRNTRPWPELRYGGKPFPIDQLPFQPVDLQQTSIADLLATSQIDHSVGPVPHTVGGSQAGYTRWENFKKQGLRRYADQRNDALKDGVSRMSAYLHYGMVSPFTLVRDCFEVGGASAEKYLDELLIWRELAWCFCHYRTDHEALSALPAWARQALKAGEADKRADLYDEETLARAQTHDPLWNAAQMSLLRQGELHNNVRMTWGKAIPLWTSTTEEALRLLFDLNHRYALDGCDPASYGGLLWCLGQFDRPFTPEEPILRSIRGRSTAEHARRLNPEKYLAKTSRRLTGEPVKVAVIGAGMAGLMAARTLSDHGFEVEVFEKSRGLGGRMATRRLADGGQFDHGCQYITARTSQFEKSLRSWENQGLITPWQGLLAAQDANGSWKELAANGPRYVGVPGMTSIARHLSQGLRVHQEVQIQKVERIANQWHLQNTQGAVAGPFDQLILAIPAGQAARLVGEYPMAEILARIPMDPCWTVMASLADPLHLPFDGYLSEVALSPAVGWAARDTSKPKRPTDAERWVLQATPAWTKSHLDLPADQVATELWHHWCEQISLQPQRTPELVAHRWMFSTLDPSKVPAEIYQKLSIERALHDSEHGLTVCGDWTSESRVEAAYLSGIAAAGFVLRQHLIAKPAAQLLF
ncbi:FAD-dependent oxidoreductase [Planctopirus hydrillae]|nr:FAD-dependent oxidoreductase [Planctopirus hydrillae]